MTRTKLLPAFVLLGALSLWQPPMASALTPKHPAKGHHAKQPAQTYREIIPTSEKTSQTWKYTTAKPAKNWFTPGFNDTAWKQGPGGFGTNPPGTALSARPGKRPPATSGCAARSTPAPLTPAQISGLVFRDFHDEDIEVYINGVPAYSAPGFITAYEYKPLSSKAKQSLHPSAPNEMAVHCHQTGGGQYVDVGIFEPLPKPGK